MTSNYPKKAILSKNVYLVTFVYKLMTEKLIIGLKISAFHALLLPDFRGMADLQTNLETLEG